MEGQEANWRSLNPEDQKSLKFINPKKNENQDLLKQLNDYVKEKLSNSGAMQKY